MYGNSPRAGRSNASSSSYLYKDSTASVPTASARSRPRAMQTEYDQRAGAQYSSSTRSHHGTTARSITSSSLNTGSVAASPASVAMPATSKTMPNLMHGRLHRRGGSGSGSTLPGNDMLATSITEREPFPDLASSAANPSPVSKVKPYLRKLSSPKEDQGRLDLSRSLADNDKLAGLGIQGSVDAFVPPGRHRRTTSTGSQMSNHSTSSRPGQPFIHPMRQAPRPYTPPTSRADSPYVPDDYDDDDDEFVDDDHRPIQSFHGKRSMSSSSVPHGAPTPLSQTITIADLGAIPKLTSASQSNLSITSTKSSKPTGSRRNTGRSEFATSPSSRTSFDKMSVLGARRSDTDPRTRDERIRAARRKFEEKEADKDRKAEKDAAKRQEAEAAKEIKRQQRQRARSDASEKGKPQRPGTSNGLAPGRTSSALGKYSFRASEEYPSPPLPTAARFQEKQTLQPPTQNTTSSPNFFVRLCSCGAKS